jgi:hypothetical protein
VRGREIVFGGGDTVGKLHGIDSIGWSHVVVRLQISRGAREVVQFVDFAPSVALGEASSAHDVQLTTNAVRPHPEGSTENLTPELFGGFLSVLFGAFRVI